MAECDIILRSKDSDPFKSKKVSCYADKVKKEKKEKQQRTLHEEIQRRACQEI